MQMFKQRSCESKKSFLRGFTLIEIIVSLAIFSIVATVALGALVRIVSANKKAQTLQSAITNLNFALDSISREMRVGLAYHCQYSGNVSPSDLESPTGCLPDEGNTVIAFKSAHIMPDSDPACRLIYAYRFEPNGDTPETWNLKKATQTDCESNQVLGSSQAPFVEVLSPDVKITNFAIGVSGDTFPLAHIFLSGYVGVRERERTYFSVQTAASARIPF